MLNKCSVYEGIIVAKVFSTCNSRFCMRTQQYIWSRVHTTNSATSSYGLRVHKPFVTGVTAYPVHHNFKESSTWHFCYNHCSAVGAKHICTPVFHNLRTCTKFVHSKTQMWTNASEVTHLWNYWLSLVYAAILSRPRTLCVYGYKSLLLHLYHLDVVQKYLQEKQ